MCVEHDCVYISLSGVDRHLFSMWVCFSVVWWAGEVLLIERRTQTSSSLVNFTLLAEHSLWSLASVPCSDQVWMTEYLKFIVFVLTGLKYQSGNGNWTRKAKQRAVSGLDFGGLDQIEFQTAVHDYMSLLYLSCPIWQFEIGAKQSYYNITWCTGAQYFFPWAYMVKEVAVNQWLNFAHRISSIWTNNVWKVQIFPIQVKQSLNRTLAAR